MAFEVLDEHEQSELVRKWLHENIMSIVVGLTLGLLLIFGWQQWKVHHSRHAMEAALQYQGMVDAYQAKREEEASKIAKVLRKDYANTAYAVFAAMRQANAALDKNDVAAADADISWAEQRASTPSLKGLVSLRLAKIKLANNDSAAALKLIESVPSGDYAALVGELRGDALMKLEKKEDARKAYEEALTHLDQNAANRSVVQMKLNDIALAVPPTAVVMEKQSS